MDTKFKVIMSAEEARRATEEYQEAAYQRCERFLINYISSEITKHASEGGTFCRIQSSNSCFPTGLTASKMMEHLASPLYQLGYKCRLVGEYGIDISWRKEKEKKDLNVEDIWEDGVF